MSDQPSTPQDIRSTAVYWYNEHLAGDLSLEDEARFQLWIEASAQHQQAYQRVSQAWFIAGQAKDDPALNEEAAPRTKKSARWSKFAVAAALILAFGISLTALQPKFFAPTPDRPAQAFQTGVGEKTTITLPDASILTLDAETDIRFADLDNERRVDLLRGRAFFKVAPDQRKFFAVYANGKRVRAIGTAFEVSIEKGAVAIVLTEGRVRVEEANSTENGTDMTPGRQLIISPDRRWTLSNVDIQKETSWKEGRLIFMNDPLAKAITEVNRYSKRKLQFEDNIIPDKQIVGVFSAGDVDDFVKALVLNEIATPISSSSDQILLKSL